MEQTYDNAVYCTYIYTYDGELKELFVKNNAPAKLSSGKTILEVKTFSMEEAGEDLLRFRCVDKNNQESSILVSIKSDKL